MTRTAKVPYLSQAHVIPGYVVIIRIDPVGRKIARMTMKCGRNAVPEVRRILRAVKVGHYELGSFPTEYRPEGVPLMVAGGLEMEDSALRWRLRGGQDTAGVGMLFGKGINGGMVDVPVDPDWVAREIVWLEPADQESEVEKPKCAGCGADEVVTELDGDCLCQSCANNWVRGERPEEAEIVE